MLIHHHQTIQEITVSIYELNISPILKFKTFQYLFSALGNQHGLSHLISDTFTQFLTIILEKKVYIALLTGFVIGIILSTVISCLVTKCRR